MLVTIEKMLRNIGLAVPKTTKTRYMYKAGDVQARQGTQRLHR